MGKRSWKSKSSSRGSSGSTCIARRQAARYVPLKVPMHGQHVPAAQHNALVRHKAICMRLSSHPRGPQSLPGMEGMGQESTQSLCSFCTAF